MANLLNLKCLEDDAMVLTVEVSEANDGAPALFFSINEDDEGVLLSDRSVSKLIDKLEDWRVKNARKGND